MFSMLSGIVILDKLLQPENARIPILATPSEIATLIRLVQSEKAKSPILVTGAPFRVEGMVIFVSLPM